MSEQVVITNGDLTATISTLGAELQSLTDSAGREYMTDGDPAFWSGRAPILFPIVGGLNGGTYRHQGREYQLPRHGFARRSEFACYRHGTDSAVFTLADNAETRASYPFGFKLSLAFAISGSRLVIGAAITNRGDEPMPAGFGYHPAFAWPLPGGGEKLQHTIEFAQDEPADVRRLDADGLVAFSEPTPLDGRSLALSPDLFEGDAIIWDKLQSRSLVYRSPQGPALKIEFENLPYLGVWQKPGASFICIEPWAGLADDAGFAGDIAQKRGIFMLAPGATRHFPMAITVLER